MYYNKTVFAEVHTRETDLLGAWLMAFKNAMPEIQEKNIPLNHSEEFLEIMKREMLKLRFEGMKAVSNWQSSKNIVFTGCLGKLFQILAFLIHYFWIISFYFGHQKLFTKFLCFFQDIYTFNDYYDLKGNFYFYKYRPFFKRSSSNESEPYRQEIAHVNSDEITIAADAFPGMRKRWCVIIEIISPGCLAIVLRSEYVYT